MGSGSSVGGFNSSSGGGTSSSSCPSSFGATANSIIPEEYVEEHNAYRCELGLEPLVWDCELAAVAQLWADHQAEHANCAMVHSTNEWRQAGFVTAGYPSHPGATAATGENLAWLSPVMWSDGRTEPQIKTGREVSGMWASEKEFYDMGAVGDACTLNTPGEQVGHYTQQVWHSTRKVGCGVSQCADGATLFACQYFPAGNYVGELPFCKANKPSDMGSCGNLASLPDPTGLTCTAGQGSCLSDGTICSVGAGGVGTCGGGGDTPVLGCSCAGTGSRRVGDSGSDGSCTACVMGTWKGVIGPSSCTLCAAGKYSNVSAQVSNETCSDCPANSHAPPGSSALTACICNAGYTGPDGGACIECPAGTFKEMSGSTPCMECARGKYLNRSASISEEACIMCPQYSTSPLASPMIINCSCFRGYTNHDGNPACVSCTSGKFKSLNGSAPCLNCEAGTYSTKLAATSSDTCTSCIAGKYSMMEGANASNACMDCLAGTYSEATSANSSETCAGCAAGIGLLPLP